MGLFSVSKIFVPSFRLSRSRLNGRGVNESRLTRPNAEERVALIGALHWLGTLVNYKSAAEILSREIESAGIVEWELKEEVGKVNKHKVFFPSQDELRSCETSTC